MKEKMIVIDEIPVFLSGQFLQLAPENTASNRFLSPLNETHSGLYQGQTKSSKPGNPKKS